MSAMYPVTRAIAKIDPSVPADVPSRFALLDLSATYNRIAITSADALASGNFNVWGNSFPAELLPTGGSNVDVLGVPFQFPPITAGQPNSVDCRGQFLSVPCDRYDWMYLLAAAERRAEDVMYLHYSDGTVDSTWLRVSDFWPDAPAHFGEQVAFRPPHTHYPHHVQRNLAPTIWRQRVAISRTVPLCAVRLPENIAIHIFAATLLRTWEPASPDDAVGAPTP